MGIVADSSATSTFSIEQERCQGNSSRSWFTNSGVAAAEPGLTRSSGTPLRKSRRDFAGCKACRE